MTDTIEQRYRAAQTIIRDAGRLALDYYRDVATLEIESKGVQDRVSEADRSVEQLIRESLAAQFPEDAFLGEESGYSGTSARFTWVVDPIDGTDCFVHEIPDWCISIALVQDGEEVVGCVFCPPSGELFHARRGGGAYCNDQPIRVNAATSLADGLVGIGFSYRVDPAITLQCLRRLFAENGVFQRNGSAALSIAYVASGRYLGFLEAHINSWDVLAGIVLVREAGGFCNGFLDNDGLYRGNPVVTGAPGVEQALRDIATEMLASD